MWIRIDPHSGVPIYRQVARQIEEAVAAGVLQPGDKLPGVRELAVELAVNPATVVKAYDELQRAGVIEQPRGRGTFVVERPTLSATERWIRMRSAIESLSAEAERLGFTPDELIQALRDVLREQREQAGAEPKEEDPNAGR
jgi:GntR family transcriptional regulator